jgi:hypothetical protein
MPAIRPDTSRIRDLEEKARSARKAADAAGAGEREKADLKLAEQKAAGARLHVGHEPADGRTGRSIEARLDKALKETFPGSDPVSLVQGAPARKENEDSDAAPEEGRPSKGKGGS